MNNELQAPLLLPLASLFETFGQSLARLAGSLGATTNADYKLSSTVNSNPESPQDLQISKDYANSRKTTTLSPNFADSSTATSKSLNLDIATSTFPSCPLDLPYSCANSSFVEDLCCFEYPGGVILATQFWDYDPATGPDDAFTLHGLWPDNCDGSFEQFCNPALEIRDPAKIVEQFEPKLLEDMHTYWKDYKGQDESLWYHEYNKHGTCYTTIRPACYGDSVINSSHREDVYDYYKAAMDLYLTLPTYDWLVADGIVPSTTETYTFDQIMNSLKKNFGATPFIKCDARGALLEVWYFHHLQGSLRTGHFNKIETLTAPRCPRTGIKFPPKGSKLPIHTRTATSAGPRPTDGSIRGSISLTNQRGCLIRNGHWYVGGSCAGYTLTPLSTGSYTLRSSGGYCTIDNDVFKCNAAVHSAFEFNYDPETGVIGANGKEVWSADYYPSGTKQTEITLGSDGSITFSLKFRA